MINKNFILGMLFTIVIGFWAPAALWTWDTPLKIPWNILLADDWNDMVAYIKSWIRVGPNNSSSDVYLWTEGNVWIWTMQPKADLEVDWIIKTTPTTDRACSADTKGGIFFDDDDDQFYWCDWVNWIPLNTVYQ